MTATVQTMIEYDIRFADYLTMPYLSQSTLKEGRLSMAHLKAALDRERTKEPTDDMLLGSALHTAFLEPEQLLDTVAKWTGKRRWGKEWDEFCTEHAGKIVITEDMNAKLTGMLRSLRRHARVREWLGKIEATEVVGLGDVRGVTMKGRCDALTVDPLIDLKKVRSCDERTVTRTILQFGYHIQGYVYRELFGRDRFLLLCVEDQEPFDVVAYELSPAFLRMGQQEAEELLDQYKECDSAGVWPGRSAEVVTVQPPVWADCGALTITVDGEAAFGD